MLETTTTSMTEPQLRLRIQKSHQDTDGGAGGWGAGGIAQTTSRGFVGRGSLSSSVSNTSIDSGDGSCYSNGGTLGHTPTTPRRRSSSSGSWNIFVLLKCAVVFLCGLVVIMSLVTLRYRKFQRRAEIQVKETLVRLDDHSELKESHENLTNREEAFKTQLFWLRQRVGKESHRMVLERFGAGPHKVEIQVELPPDPAYPNIEKNPKFTINLHSVEKIPHAVHLFLEQVAHGLWDGMAFPMNTDSVFQAGEMPGGWNSGMFAKQQKLRRERFFDKELDGMFYQEYDEEFPHVQYTIGFAGRPWGGPEWYINKIDNTELHGPHGRKDADIVEDADPCFGKIDDESIAVVERLFALPTSEEEVEGEIVLAKPLLIMQARILGWEEGQKFDYSSPEAILDYEEEEEEIPQSS